MANEGESWENLGDLGPYMQIIFDHWITGVLVIAVVVFIAVNFYNQRRKVNLKNAA